MAAIKKKITFANEKVISLSPGEINAIERCARQNGTDPKRPQYNPGSVQYATLDNLVTKGIMRRDERGLYYFSEGFLPVANSTINSTAPFTLSV